MGYTHNWNYYNAIKTNKLQLHACYNMDAFHTHEKHEEMRDKRNAPAMVPHMEHW